ncbi:MAG TPA: type IV toxin-antitoxin system AbiEi family antitoxin domain-containing protein [Gemmatimonadales bacterium]|nr:type IV toxin-antitoxin system AbiEi family antitoxin domain-containing protein [Gemmatimonadales bacterium]
MARAVTPRGVWLDRLPPTFSHAQAVEQGLSDWALARLREEGLLERPGCGWYVKLSEAVPEPELLAIAARAPLATLCLRSALVRHGSGDDIPRLIDVALPAGSRRPSLSIPIA